MRQVSCTPTEMLRENGLPQVDVTAPEHVEVRIRGDKKVVWVNIDGVCVLRVCRIPDNCCTIVNDHTTAALNEGN